MKIVWSKKAANSLESYLDFIAMDKPETAEKWAERVFKKIESILQYPNIGKELKPSGKPSRKSIVIEKNYLAIYKIIKDRCLIVAFRRTCIHKSGS